ncbi:MAG TPA: 50S ribosomal protein L3 [Planctomycetaceae bacterium]|nr:50S ribosomal protein L3 [Planctomycetaceae bacterium]HCD03568.1 50S ribosomal protein L3 [Planctomycetaceae bacterium]|tara:strand:- start:1261 stop:1983 length:723 start_codon:yes stop_codon:yes gene_type:complete
MPVGLLGRKVGMTQVYSDDGDLIPVTVVEAGPCVVLQLKTVERDGYEAVQLGYLDKKRPVGGRRTRSSQASRSQRGHVVGLSSKRSKARAEAGVEPVEKANCEPKKFVREFRVDGENVDLEVGQTLTVELFAEMSHVDVVGTSKGRGFAGVMKRHNFAGQRASHGVKRVHRHGGGIGMSADPARVLKGTRMPGRFGNARSTVRHMQVVRVDAETNSMLIKGGVPGPPGGYVLIRPTNKLG